MVGSQTMRNISIEKRPMNRNHRLFRGMLAGWLAYSLMLVALPAARGTEPVDFTKQILPLLRKHCVACHNNKTAEGGLILENHEALMRGGDSGATISTDAATTSLLVDRITGAIEPIMPPEGNSVGAKPWTAEEVQLLKQWIAEGANPGSGEASASWNWQPLPGQLQPIYAAAATADGQYAAVGRGNRLTIYRWPAIHGAEGAQALIDPAVKQQLGDQAPDASHLDLIQSIAFSPDGQWLASGGFREVKLWKRKVEPLATSPWRIEGAAATLAATPDGSRIALALADQSVVLGKGETRLAILSPRSAAVRHLAISPSGQRLLVGLVDGRWEWWNLEGIPDDGSAAAQPLGDERRLGEKADGGSMKQMILLDNDRLATLDEGGAVGLWEIAPPADPNAPAAGARSIVATALATPVAPASAIARLESPTAAPYPSPRIALAAEDGSVRIAELPTGNVLATLAHGAPVRSVASSPDGQLIASAATDASIKFWKVADGQMASEVRGTQNSQRLLRQTQRQLARQNGRIERLAARIPEMEKGVAAETEARTKQQAVRDKAAEMVAAKVKEMETATAAMTAAQQAVEQAMKDLEAKKQEVAKAETAKKQAETELATQDQTLKAADEAIERAKQAIPTQQMLIEKEKQILAQHQQAVDQATAAGSQIAAVRQVTFSADGRSAIALHEDQTLQVIRVDRAKPEALLAQAPAEVQKLVCSQSGQLLAAHPGGTTLWDLRLPWELVRSIGNHQQSPISDRVTALDFHPNGQLLAVGSGPASRVGQIAILSLADGSVVKDMPEVHSDSVVSLRFSPDGTLLASGGADKIIRLFDTSSWQFQRTMEGHTHHVLGLAWQDDGQTLASASADNTIKIWDSSSGQQLRTIGGFGKEVTALGYLGQTQQLYSASADQQARLHEGSNGQGIRSFGGAADALYAAAVAEDGPWILAGGQDGKLWIWQIDNGQALQQIQ